LFGIALLFFIARIAIRVKFNKRVFWDDGWAFFAIICLLANAILTHAMLQPMYVTIKMQQWSASIKRDEGEVDLFASIVQFLKFQFAETMIFWTCLWSVKASFLAFFKRLTTNVRGHLVAWWIIVVITALAYIGCAITYPVSCSEFTPRKYNPNFDRPLLMAIVGCTKPRNVRLALVSLRFSTCVDVLTDVMIIAIPMSLAWRVKLPWKPRLALFGVFSLGGVIIVFAIIRVVFTNKQHRQPEISWLNLWSAIEAGIACIVCNLAPFKVLFPGRARNYSSDPYRYGGRYAKDEKKTAESHELSLSSQSDRVASHKEARPSVVPRGNYPYPPPVIPRRAPGRSPHYASMHLPRGVHKGLLRVSISADNRGNFNPYEKDGILVTQEVERKIVTADQVTVSSTEVLDHDRPLPMRTTWYDRPSDDSVDKLLPATVLKAFA
jgi:hypothetical protein